MTVEIKMEMISLSLWLRLILLRLPRNLEEGTQILRTVTPKRKTLHHLSKAIQANSPMAKSLIWTSIMKLKKLKASGILTTRSMHRMERKSISRRAIIENSILLRN